MRRKRFAVLAAVALTLSVGCGGARIKALEGELGACKETKVTMSGENAALQEANAQLQARVDETAKLAEARKAQHDDLQSAVLPMIDAGQVGLSMRGGLVTLALSADVLFDPGKTEVKKDARAMLVQLAAALKDVDAKLLIGGHTDARTVKEKKAKSRDNWELTTEQAYGVYAVLSATGLERGKLGIAGFGDADPVADNGTPEGQTLNRRIEIVLMPDMQAVLPVVAQVQRQE